MTTATLETRDDVSTLEQLIQRHRPAPERENDPASTWQLDHLNRHKLLGDAMARLGKGEGVISRLVAWEVLADAQRAGLSLTPQKYDKKYFRQRPRPTTR